MTVLQNYFTLAISLSMHLFACFPSVSIFQHRSGQPWQRTNFLKPIMFQSCGEWSISVDLKYLLKLDQKLLSAHCILLTWKLKGLRTNPLLSILLKWLDSCSAKIDSVLSLSWETDAVCFTRNGTSWIWTWTLVFDAHFNYYISEKNWTIINKLSKNFIRYGLSILFCFWSKICLSSLFKIYILFIFVCMLQEYPTLFLATSFLWSYHIFSCLYLGNCFNLSFNVLILMV